MPCRTSSQVISLSPEAGRGSEQAKSGHMAAASFLRKCVVRFLSDRLFIIKTSRSKIFATIFPQVLADIFVGI